jgi:hypothetical protein
MEVGGDFDHMLVCFGKEPIGLEFLPREPRFMMIEITMNCDGGHRNANPIGLD